MSLQVKGKISGAGPIVVNRTYRYSQSSNHVVGTNKLGSMASGARADAGELNADERNSYLDVSTVADEEDFLHLERSSSCGSNCHKRFKTGRSLECVNCRGLSIEKDDGQSERKYSYSLSSS